jgi:hypothetical protein
MNTDYITDRRMLDQNIEALSMMARQRVADGWNASLLTMTFAQIPGSPAAVVGRMGDAAGRLYSTLVTNVVRRPASASAVGKLPVMIGAPDLPVPKLTKTIGPVIALNGGAHFHALLITPERSRLRTTVEKHFQAQRRLYARPPVDSLDVRSITRTPERALEYVLKSVRRGRFTFDDVLILPRALSELRA